MAVNRDLSKFALHIFNHENGHIGLATDASTFIGIGIENPGAKLHVNGDFRVEQLARIQRLELVGVGTFLSDVDIDGNFNASGISTFGGNVTFNGNTEFVGISTFGTIELEDLISKTANITESLNTVTISADRESYSYNGKLVGIGTNIIQDTIVTSLRLGLVVSGENISAGSTIIGIGTINVGVGSTATAVNAITLSQNSTNGIINLSLPGIFYSAGGNVVTGIVTDNILVGYGITNAYIGAGTTVTDIGISSITMSQNATNTTYLIETSGTLSGVGTNIMTGIDTTGVQIGQFVSGDFLSVGITTVTEIRAGEITFSPQSFTSGGINTSTYQIYFQDTFEFYSTDLNPETEAIFTYSRTISGIGTIYDLEGENLEYNTGYISSVRGLNLSYGTADLDNITSDNISVTNLDAITLTVGAGDTQTILDPTSGRIDNLDGINLNYTGFSTIATILSNNIRNTGIITANEVQIDSLDANNIVVTGVSTFVEFGAERSQIGVLTATTLEGTSLDYSVGIISEFTVRNVEVTDNLSVSGITTAPTLDTTDGSIDNITSVNQTVSGISTLNLIVGVTSVYTSLIDATSGIVTTISGEDLNYNNSAILSNVKIGIGETELIVSGDARVTGILTVGPDSVTIDGIQNSITGITSIDASVGTFTTISGTRATYTNVDVDNINFSGINTANSLEYDVNIKPSESAFSTSYNLTLPPYLGIPGQVLQLQEDGQLGFSTAGLYENRIYVSPVNGDDGNDGKAQPVKTIKKAAQLASFESFVLPGSRFADAGDLLLNNKAFIQNEVVGFVTYTHPGITTNPDYDSTKCSRDVGLIVDALYYDLTYGGNSKTIEAGLKYWAGTTNYVAGETTETIDAYNHIITISQYVINNVALPDTIDRFNDGSNLLILNKSFIQEEVVGFVTSTYPGLLSNPDYDETKCRRDVGLIVDAITYDLAYGGNRKSVEAGLSYWSGATNYVSGETTETIAAYNHIVGISSFIINNTSIPTSYQSTVTQQFDNTISYDDSCSNSAYDSTCCANVQSAISNYVGIITSIIGIGTTAAPTLSQPTGSFQPESGQTFQSFDLTISYDEDCGAGTSFSQNCCADVFSAISNYVGIVTSIIGIGTTAAPTLNQPTSKSTPVAVFVEAGEYLEDNPILMYEDVAIIGDNLRNTIIRPLNAGKDLFRVRNGCYLTGFAMKDFTDAAGVPQFTFDNAVAYDDPSDTTTPRTGYAVKTDKPIITRSPYVQNCSILSFLGANGILVDGSKVDTLNTAIIPQEAENPVEGPQPEFGKSMVAAAFTMVSFGGIGWRVINDGYSQVVSCFQIFCRYGSLAQSGGYLSITNSATNFGLYALRSTGFNSRSYNFDRGVIAATGTSGGLQTLKVVGLGRSDQDLYVLRFFSHAGVDLTSNFKPSSVVKEVDISVGVSTNTDIIGITSHTFNTGDSVIYLGDESTIPKQVIGGLVNLNEYYVQYVSDDEFKLYEDDSLTRLVDLTSVTTGINTFIKGNQEFFNFEKLDSHQSYQRISFASTTSNLTFITGREITQQTNGGNAVGIAVTYNSTENELLVSVESSGGVRNNFGVTGFGVNAFIQDHSASPVSAAATAVAGVGTFFTVEFKVDSTQTGGTIAGISQLPEEYRIHFHRPSIINSSSHTWEFSGSGTDYNALPQNGGKTDPATEQVFIQGGRVYSSGTNELGDFKIGNFITAFNRTGNIVFNNKVSIGQLDSLRLSLSGGVSIEEFSTDIGLGDNEVGGAKDFRVSTQKAVRTFLNNRLGNFIDKEVSTNAVPSAIVQLNAFGQINADLIPPKVVNYYTADVGGGRTTLVDRIPAVDLKNGDTVLEPGQGYVLISDVYSQFLILGSNTRDYNFNNGDIVTSAVSDGGAIGVVTAPTSVGYGTTGLVKGVALTASVIDGGSGYTNPGIYTSVLLNNSVTGAGVSANATITVGASGTVTQCSIVYGGRYYAEEDTVSISNPAALGGRSGGSEFQARIETVETRLYLELTNNQKFTGSSLLTDYIADGDAVGVSTSMTAQYIVSFTPNSTGTGGDVDFTNDRLVIGANEFADGDPITYSAGGGNVLESLVSGNTYYVKRVGISSVELYTTYNLTTKVDFLSNGTGTHTLTRKTINPVTDQITFVGHPFTTGDAVRIGSNVPVGLTTASFYFVGSVTTNSFSLHSSQSISLSSVNGLIFNPINITQAGVGDVTFTKQNVDYSATVNTSSSLLDNWTVLASGTVDAANITSGTISPSRLGSGTANSDTFLGGDSVYRKAVKSVGIGTTAPLSIVADSFELDGDITKYFGDIRLSVLRVQASLDNFSTTGVAKFKTSTFEIGNDGAVSIKNSQFGDVDAASLGGFAPAYYLDLNNTTGTIPIPRGGTGLSALPSNGAILIGNGSAYTLTGAPTLSGRITAEYAVKANGDIELNSGTWSGDKSCKIQNSNNELFLQYTTNLIARNSAGTNRLTLSSTGNLDVTGNVRGSTLTSDVANGTAPITVTSTTVATNLNADMVDGIQGSSLLRSDTNDSMSASNGPVLSITKTGSAPGNNNTLLVTNTYGNHSWGITGEFRIENNSGSDRPSILFSSGFNSTTWSVGYGYSDDNFRIKTGHGHRNSGWGTTRFSIDSSGNLYAGELTNKIWHAGNDGAGSGLDADNLDGYTWTSSGKNIRGTEIYADNWFRNYNAGEGLYNEATGCHFVSDGTDEWTVRDAGNSIRIEFQTNGTTLRGSVYADNAPSIGFLNSNNEWGLRYLSNNGNSPNLYFREEGNETWTGNPGNDMGKIEYHSNRFYIAAGGNSTEILRFRRSGSDVGYVANDGNIYATSSNHKVWHAGNDGSGSGLDADVIDGIDSSRIIFGENSTGTDSPSNWNAFLKSGFHNRSSATGSPGSTWYHMINNRHTNTGNNYQMQFAGEFYNASNIYYRIINNNSPTSWYKMWHSGNDGSGSGLDADTLDGLQLHTGRNNSANRVVRTDGNGYIQAGWINTTSGTSQDSKPSRWYSSHDAYLRYMTANRAKMWLGLTYKSTYARRDSTTNTHYWVGTMGWGTTNMNSVMDWGSGFFDSWSNPANQPSGTSHWVGVQALHYTNGSSRYGWQLCGGPIENLRLRSAWNSFRSWRTVPVLDVNSNNGGAMYAGNYYDANNTGYYSNPGDTSRMNQIRANTYYSPYSGSNSGLGRSSYPYGWGFQESGGWSNPYPDLVLQYHTGVTMAGYQNYNGITFKSDYNNNTVRFRINGGSGYTYKYTWMYTNTTGYYSDTNSWHISPNSSTSYGSMDIRGTRGGWYGLGFHQADNDPHLMFDNSGNGRGGLYWQGGGRWALFYDHSNNCLGICGSSTSSTYELYVSGDIYATGSVTAASDRRLKKNIQTIEGSLEKILNLRGVTFEWDLETAKNRKSGTKIGLIAQEVIEVVPEVVTYAEDADEYSVEYGNMTALLIEAMKEQNEMINTLREEVAELKKKLGE